MEKGHKFYPSKFNFQWTLNEKVKDITMETEKVKKEEQKHKLIQMQQELENRLEEIYSASLLKSCIKDRSNSYVNKHGELQSVVCTTLEVVIDKPSRRDHWNKLVELVNSINPMTCNYIM